MGGKGQAFWVRDVPCSVGLSLGLSLGRGQPALGMRPLQVAADPKSLDLMCPASTSGVDIKYMKGHLLLVPVFVHHPLAGEDAISVYKLCVIADDQVLLVKHLGLSLQLALSFFSAPLTVSPGHPGMFLAGAAPPEREREEREHAAGIEAFATPVGHSPPPPRSPTRL